MCTHIYKFLAKVKWENKEINKEVDKADKNSVTVNTSHVQNIRTSA